MTNMRVNGSGTFTEINNQTMAENIPKIAKTNRIL